MRTRFERGKVLAVFVTTAALAGISLPVGTAAAAPGSSARLASTAPQSIQLSASRVGATARKLTQSRRTVSNAAQAALPPPGRGTPCYGDSHAVIEGTSDFDNGQMDARSFGMFYSCDTHALSFSVSTANAWSPAQLGQWDVLIDTDGTLTDNPGCNGFEYEALANSPAPGAAAGIYRLTSTSPTTCSPTLVGPVAVDFQFNQVALSFDYATIGSPGMFFWGAALQTVADVAASTATTLVGDVVPDTTLQNEALPTVQAGCPASATVTAKDGSPVFSAATNDSAAGAGALRKAGFARVSQLGLGGGMVTFTGDPIQAQAVLSGAHLTGEVSVDHYLHTESSSATPPNDPLYGSQWELAAVNAAKAWSFNNGSSSVVVADLDTGADYTHEDLAGKLTTGIDETATPPAPISSGNQDPVGHGTAVAGVIGAATNNGKGLASLGWNTMVMPVKVGTNGSAISAATVTAGINDVVAGLATNSVKVINLSLGGPCRDTQMANAILNAQNHGVLVVASAGNDAMNAAQPDAIGYPAALPNVVAVGALGHDGQRAGYSNTGAYVSIAAPGGDASATNPPIIANDISVLCSKAGSTEFPPGTCPTGYSHAAGTSFSAPLVSAAAALVFAAQPTWTAAQVSADLTSTATDIGVPGRDYEYGFGALNAGLALAVATSSPSIGSFVPVSPIRVLDTRSGTGALPQKIGAGQSIYVQVTGAGGVIPTSGVSGVVMHVAAVSPTVGTYLTLWPADQPMPLASNVNAGPGPIANNLVVSRVSTSGYVGVFNAGGTTDVVADIVGWYSDGTTASGAFFTPMAPTRFLDTRNSGFQPLGAGTSLDLQITGAPNNIPAGATGVALNLTAVSPTVDTYLTVWPTGAPRPLAANLNVSANQIFPNLVTAAVGTGGKISIFNAGGAVNVVVDVVGYYSASGSQFHPIQPVRMLDTRTGTGVPAAKVGPGASITLQVGGVALPVPANASTVVINVTVVNGTTASYLTVYPADAASVPLASNLNFGLGDILPNLVIAKLSSTGAIKIFNAGGTVDVVGDVVGYYS